MSGAAPDLPADTIFGTAGATPVLRLRALSDAVGRSIILKLEHLAPTGSAMDRVARAMFARAEGDGRLRPGEPVVVPTTGNLGIALALICSAKGHPIATVMPQSMSLERRALLDGHRANVVLTPADAHMAGALQKAKALASEMRGAWLADPFEDPANVAAHAESTWAELQPAIADAGGIDAFVSVVGTGGTIRGVGRALKAAFPKARLVAVEPAESPVLSGGAPGLHRIHGLPAAFVPPHFDRSVVDEIRAVPSATAWDVKTRLAREEGLLVGPSTGANVAAAIEVASSLPPGARVFTIACDSGERYFSVEETR